MKEMENYVDVSDHENREQGPIHTLLIVANLELAVINNSA